MSEKIEAIKPDVLIDIKFSEPFIKRLQQLAVYFSRLVDPEVLKQQAELMKEDKELSEWGFNFQTILILLKEAEEKAKEQEKTYFIDLPKTPLAS